MKKPLAAFVGSWSMSEEEKIFGEISELWRRYEEGYEEFDKPIF